MQLAHFETYPRIAPSNFSNEFKNKTVLITGGGRGIGVEIAKSFAEAHAKSIILVGRSESHLISTAKTLEAYKDTTSVETRAVDISSTASVKELFNSLKNSPDVLVNNAGYLSSPTSIIDADLEEYWKSFQINVFGTISITQAYLRHRRANAPADAPAAAILNFNTAGAFSIRMPAVSAYASSKAALMRWTELLQNEIPVSEARIFSIHPGVVVTEMHEKAGLGEVYKDFTTDKRLGADFSLWASSEEAGFLAGRFLFVNWDVDELIRAKEEILEKDLFRTSLLE